MPALENVREYGARVASRPGSPFRHVMSCDALTTNETVWPTEILRFVGVNAKPLCVMVLVGAVVVVVVVVVGLTVVAVLGATVVVVTGSAVVAGIGTIREILLVDVFAG